MSMHVVRYLYVSSIMVDMPRYIRVPAVGVDAYLAGNLPSIPGRRLAVMRSGKTLAHVPPDVLYPETSVYFYREGLEEPGSFSRYRPLYRDASAHYPTTGGQRFDRRAANRADRHEAVTLLRRIVTGDLDPDDYVDPAHSYWS